MELLSCRSLTKYFVRSYHDASKRRLASAEVSKGLEACEDELKSLETELEELTEIFENINEQTRTDAGNDEFGWVLLGFIGFIVFIIS